MGIFGSSESYLGVDIGNSALKVVELKNEKGRPKLVTYGYLEQANQILKSDSPEAKAAIVKGLKQVCEKSRVSTKKAIAALPSYTVFSSIIHLPELPKKEMEAAVNVEAKKFVPMPLEEMILDYKTLENTPELSRFTANSSAVPSSAPNAPAASAAVIDQKQQQFVRLLLTAAPKQLVSRYVDIFKEAGLELVSLETEAFALERSLIGRDKAPIMIVDIGAVATTLSVIVDSVPLINRSIDMGGLTITKAIANSLNIDLDRAEQFKRDFGLSNQTSGTTSQIPSRIEFMVSSVINEIKYVLNLYASQANGNVEKIILAGGSAWLPNFPAYLSQSLNTKVYIGDPWARVIYPVELKPVLQDIGPRLAVSVGLAMREIS